jgi:hypothetical protein
LLGLDAVNLLSAFPAIRVSLPFHRKGQMLLERAENRRFASSGAFACQRPLFHFGENFRVAAPPIRSLQKPSSRRTNLQRKDKNSNTIFAIGSTGVFCRAGESLLKSRLGGIG